MADRDVRAFLKDHKRKKKNVFFRATKNFTDETGRPLQWELKPIKSKDLDQLRADCTWTDKDGIEHFKDAEFSAKMYSMAVVFPDLRSAELQDSYGVTSPEDLLYELIDDAGEWTSFQQKVNDMNGFGVSMDDKVAEAKNS
jgi:hypothetical protein